MPEEHYQHTDLWASVRDNDKGGANLATGTTNRMHTEKHGKPYPCLRTETDLPYSD